MASHEFLICDVFTDRKLAGNQLAVFPDATQIPEQALQPLAREMNFSETVFCYEPRPDGLPVRIFTPTVELPFAGHPVLGTAAVMAERARCPSLVTGSGVVAVDVRSTGTHSWRGAMIQPLPTIEPFGATAELLSALGVRSSALPVEIYDNGVRHIYVALPSVDEVASLAPRQDALMAAAPRAGVNCFAGGGRSWKTRMFGPGVGVAEDPATGSAAGPLALHLCRHGLLSYGEEIEISQGAEIGRPSTLYASVTGAEPLAPVIRVGGAVVLIAEGRIHL